MALARLVTVTLLTIAVLACARSPQQGGSSGPSTIRDYRVQAGHVQVVTGLSGTLADYAGPSSYATLSDMMFYGSDGAPNTWVPIGVATSVDATGAFSIVLPVKPGIGPVGSVPDCGTLSALPRLTGLFVHDGATDNPGDVTAIYAQFVSEEPHVRVAHFVYDALLSIEFVYSSTDLTSACVSSERTPLGAFVFDVDLRLEPGWNATHRLSRAEPAGAHLYWRSGYPRLSLEWRLDTIAGIWTTAGPVP